jgi:hypothetical protein
MRTFAGRKEPKAGANAETEAAQLDKRSRSEKSDSGAGRLRGVTGKALCLFIALPDHSSQLGRRTE